MFLLSISLHIITKQCVTHSRCSFVLQALTAVTLSVGSAARTKRQRHTPSGDKQVIVNIEDEEKTQYLEQNFNSSKILIGLLITHASK
jgi:hypothetical protein